MESPENGNYINLRTQQEWTRCYYIRSALHASSVLTADAVRGHGQHRAAA